MGKAKITTEYLEKVFPAFKELKDQKAKKQITEVYQDMFEMCNWDSIEKACFSPALSNCRLVDHINAVMASTLATARCIDKYQGIPFDYDGIIILAMLHDSSKLVEYEPTPDGCKETEIGKKIQHGEYGAMLAKEHGFSVKVMNQILTHTPRSKMKPSDKEGALFARVDISDADMLHYTNGLPLFD